MSTIATPLIVTISIAIIIKTTLMLTITLILIIRQ